MDAVKKKTATPAVDDLVAELRSLLRESRQGMDQAASAFVYVAGNLIPDGHAYYPADRDSAARFNDGMAQAAGAIVGIERRLTDILGTLGRNPRTGAPRAHDEHGSDFNMVGAPIVDELRAEGERVDDLDDDDDADDDEG